MQLLATQQWLVRALGLPLLHVSLPYEHAVRCDVARLAAKDEVPNRHQLWFLAPMNAAKAAKYLSTEKLKYCNGRGHHLRSVT